MVAEGGEGQGSREGSPGPARPVPVPSGVQHVQPPVRVLPRPVPRVVQLRPVVSGLLLYNQQIAGQAVHGEPERGAGGRIARGAGEGGQLKPGQPVLQPPPLPARPHQPVPHGQAGRVGQQGEQVGQQVLQQLVQPALNPPG